MCRFIHQNKLFLNFLIFGKSRFPPKSFITLITGLTLLVIPVQVSTSPKTFWTKSICLWVKSLQIDTILGLLGLFTLPHFPASHFCTAIKQQRFGYQTLLCDLQLFAIYSFTIACRGAFKANTYRLSVLSAHRYVSIDRSAQIWERVKISGRYPASGSVNRDAARWHQHSPHDQGVTGSNTALAIEITRTYENIGIYEPSLSAEVMSLNPGDPYLLEGSFSHLFVVKFELMFDKTKNKRKRGLGWSVYKNK